MHSHIVYTEKGLMSLVTIKLNCREHTSSPSGGLREMFAKKNRKEVARLEKHIKSKIGSISCLPPKTGKVHFHWN